MHQCNHCAIASQVGLSDFENCQYYIYIYIYTQIHTSQLYFSRFRPPIDVIFLICELTKTLANLC